MDVSSGTRVLLEFFGRQDRVAAHYVGFIKDYCVLTTLPIFPGIRQALVPNNKVVVRYVHRGTVYGFASRILHHFTSPTGLLMLTYPMHTETHNLRKHKRVDCYFPAHAVHANQNFHGLILNVSMGGCKVLLDMDRHYGNEHFRDGDEIHLDFYVLERIHTYSVRARVIHAEMEGDKLALGLMFLEDEDKIRRIVADYISEVSRALGL